MPATSNSIVAAENPTEAVWIDDVKFESVSVYTAKRDVAVAVFEQGLAADNRKHLAEVNRKTALLTGGDQEPVIRLGVHVALAVSRSRHGPAAGAVDGPVGHATRRNRRCVEETGEATQGFRSLQRGPRPLRFPLGGNPAPAIRDGCRLHRSLGPAKTDRGSSTAWDTSARS